MSEKNRAEYSSQDIVKLFMEISTPPLNAEELAYQQKCFQSFADLKTQKKTGSSIICMSCWAKWHYMIKECPLCRSKTPENGFRVASSTKSSGKCVKISGKVVSPIKVTNTCTICFNDFVEEVDEEYEQFLKECGHAHCNECSKRWFNEIHDCLFCGKKMSLLKLVENKPGFPKVRYRCGSFRVNCSECLRRWAPGDSRCPFCSFLLTIPCNANKKDEPSSNVDNISENQKEVRKDHEDQNPVSKIVMEDACSTFHEIENPVNTSANQAPTSNTFDSFGNEKQEQVPANEIDPTTSKDETVIEAPVSDNRGLSASENVSNGTANETYRGLETANDGHVSKLSEDATIGPEGLLTLGQEGDNEYTCAEN